MIYSNVQSALPSQEELWDATSQTPWMRTQDPGWQQTWFEDANSLAAKYQTVLNEGLAGVGIWALGYDDPYTDLWNALHTAFDQTTADVAPQRHDAGLHIVSSNPFSAGVALSFFPTSLAQETVPMVVEVFDARGRLIRTLSPAPTASTEHQFYWDGRKRSGSAAPRGVYMARVVGSTQATRLIKVR